MNTHQRAALVIGSLLTINASVGTTTTPAMAGPSLGFSIPSVACGAQSFTARVSNGSLATIAGGTARMGAFRGTFPTIAAGASVNVTLSAYLSPLGWACGTTSLSLQLSNGTATYTIPAMRATKEVEVEFGGMTHDMWLDSFPLSEQRFLCSEDEPAFAMRAVLIPFNHVDESEVWFEGGLTSDPVLFEPSFDESFFDVPFDYAAGSCPRTPTTFEVHQVNDGETWLEEFETGTVRPVRESAKGAIPI